MLAAVPSFLFKSESRVQHIESYQIDTPRSLVQLATDVIANVADKADEEPASPLMLWCPSSAAIFKHVSLLREVRDEAAMRIQQVFRARCASRVASVREVCKHSSLSEEVGDVADEMVPSSGRYVPCAACANPPGSPWSHANTIPSETEQSEKVIIPFDAVFDAE